jgi:hypothetical protein
LGHKAERDRLRRRAEIGQVGDQEVARAGLLMGRARDDLAANPRSFPFGRATSSSTRRSKAESMSCELHSARDVDAAFGDEQ